MQAHESYGQSGGKGHQGQIERGLNTSTCKDAAGIAERVVADDLATANRIMQELREEADKAFGHLTWHNFVHGNYNGDLVVFGPNDTIAPQAWTRTDAPTPSLGSTPGKGCSWSGAFQVPLPEKGKPTK